VLQTCRRLGIGDPGQEFLPVYDLTVQGRSFGKDCSGCEVDENPGNGCCPQIESNPIQMIPPVAAFDMDYFRIAIRCGESDRKSFSGREKFIVLLPGHMRARAGIALKAKGTMGCKNLGFRCRLQEILHYNGRKGGMRIRVRLEDTGGINPALDRECEFTIIGNEGLAGTAVMMEDLIRCQAPDARGRTCRAGSGKNDHLAFAAFPLSPADTFKRYLSTPYCFEYGRIPWYRDPYICGTEEYAGSIRHTLLR